MSDKAVVFAGQGAQAVGMGRDLAEAYPECRALFAEADQALGYSLSRICFEGPIEELTRSDRCQPAIFVVSVACWRALLREAPGLRFCAAAGLSLGEWTALHAAGVLSFADALRALEARGRFMQEACEARAGGMVSVVGLPVAKLVEICAATGVEIANLNSADQTVLSGEKQAIAEAEKMAAAAGAKRVIVLNVAGAFHSRLMAPAAEKLERTLLGVPFQAPALPVASNATGALHGAPEEIRRQMVRQVTSPVQWIGCVQALAAAGARGFCECGPGKVLSGLIRRIEPAARVTDTQDVATLKKTVEALKAW
jgi:[acyl-carrier-protein] S-malonyltransferase